MKAWQQFFGTTSTVGTGLGRQRYKPQRAGLASSGVIPVRQEVQGVSFDWERLVIEWVLSSEEARSFSSENRGQLCFTGKATMKNGWPIQ